jgi:N-formylglutamate amidohydrolase
VSFILTEPRAKEVPIVVEVPHAGLELDAEVLSTLVAPAQSIARDADLYVDELYADAPDCGATLLSARMSRYVCDLNRSEQDVDRDTVHGFVIVLSGHSMPSRGRDGHDDPGRDRADVVPGTRQRTTAADAVIDTVEQVASRFRLRLAHDDPYRGGHTTVRYGRPAAGMHSIQVELNRKLYMDEQTLVKKQNEFRVLRSFCRALVQGLAALSAVPRARAGRG